MEKNKPKYDHKVKKCVQCGEEFVSKSYKHKFCNILCVLASKVKGREYLVRESLKR